MFTLKPSSVLWVPLGTKDSTTDLQTPRHFVVFWGTARDNPMRPSSFSSVLLHAILGLPLFHFPSGVQNSAFWQMSDLFLLNVCPMNHHFLGVICNVMSSWEQRLLTSTFIKHVWPFCIQIYSEILVHHAMILKVKVQP